MSGYKKTNIKRNRPACAPVDENARYFSERLKRALSAMLNSPLTVVEAPMGYGKTEAVKEFVRTFPVRAIWTSATQASPEFFWPDFCRELAQEAPEARDASAALEALGFPHDLVQRSAALKLLRQLSFTQKTFLIFDDCHFLPRSFIDFCESLDGERLHNLHVVCITRHAWASSKELLYPQSHLSWMDRNVFALTPAEICDYYALHGISLNPEEADKLHASTEGWISALRLGLSWCKTTGSFSSFPTDIAIHMKEAIHRMVYAPLSAEAKDLLFAIAPLERFTAAQASRLYMNDVVPLLEELTCKNAFVVFHPKSKIYSVHAIFRQFLLELFEDDSLLPPERRRDIYRACGDMFMEANEPASAMDAWHKAKDFERALTVLESDMSRHPITERANFYFTMFQDCPEDILERHMGASFKYAIAAFSAGDFSAFGARMAWLAKRCAAMPPGKEADHWRGELHVLQALAEFNDIEAMSRHHKMALALLKAPTSLYGADSAWALGSPSVLFMFYRESGKLKDAQRLMHECMPTYYQLTSYHGAGAEYLMETEALYNAGEFAKAGEACQTALAKAARHNQIGNMFCAMFLQIRLALLAGDATALFGREAQLGLLADMRGLIARNRDFFLLHTADLCEGWLYATLGLYKKIPPWLRSELSEESRLYAFAKGCYYIVHGRAQLLAGEYFKLIGQFSGMLLAGAFSKNLLFFVYAHIYLAAAHEKTGQSQKAATTLNIALSVALPDALYMPFVENYDLIGPLLTKNLSGKNDQQALSRIEALAQQMKAGSESVLKKIQALRQLWGLTPREFEAALLIGKGLSYQQIADKMCVSVNTLKTHLQSITRKSGVSRRKGLYEIFRKD